MYLMRGISSVLDSATRAKIAESNHICHSNSLSYHSERSEESKNNPFVILSEAKYLKNHNRDSSRYRAQNDNLKENTESTLDSADSQNLVKNNPSLRADSQNLRGKPPIEKIVELQKIRLPRSLMLARNDENLDSSLRLRSAQNDKVGIYDYNFGVRVAESTSDLRGSIFDEKSGLCSCEREDRTDEFIDEASGKSPRFITKRQTRNKG